MTIPEHLSQLRSLHEELTQLSAGKIHPFVCTRCHRVRYAEEGRDGKRKWICAECVRSALAEEEKASR